MKNTLNIVLSGEAGQGLATIEDFLVKAIAKQYYVFSSKEVMSRVRGGNNTVLIRVSSSPVRSYAHHIDLLYLLNDHSLYRLLDRIDEHTLILGEEAFINQDLEHSSKFVSLKAVDIAVESGSVLYANTVLFGHIAGLLGLDMPFCHQLIDDKFADKGEKKHDGNIKAFDLGYELGSQAPYTHGLLPREKKPTTLLHGTSAIGMGALAGGCDFVAAYPMSPATGVLQYMAGVSKKMDVLVEQAEDEIAAINMIIGAWYTGARALTTTSGGGFALMEEGVSLSGITETPAVIHIAQRPGPATGLPTRTAQEDLNLAVYAGHGEFPRIVLTPGSMKDCVLLTQKAFNLADKHQVPVFILSDQYLLDSVFQEEPIEIVPSYESYIVETADNYKRYALSHDGLSKRGIPGFGQGLVKCDSDEHTEDGMITEDFEVRIAQNDKRFSKEKGILNDYQEPELFGDPNYHRLIVGWGSTYGVLREYIEQFGETGEAFLYIKQPFPLPKGLANFFEQAEDIISVENNATGQFANLLKLHLDIKVTDQLLKYNGVPFSIEEITHHMKED